MLYDEKSELKHTLSFPYTRMDDEYNLRPIARRL